MCDGIVLYWNDRDSYFFQRLLWAQMTDSCRNIFTSCEGLCQCIVPHVSFFLCRKTLVNLWEVLDKKEDNRNNGSTRNLLCPPSTKMASFWEKTNANVKCSGTYEWTSLIGSDKTSFMELLQTRLEQIKWHHLPRNQATSDKALVRFPSTFQNHEWIWTQSWTAAWRCPKGKRIHQPVYSSL